MQARAAEREVHEDFVQKSRAGGAVTIVTLGSQPLEH